MGDIVSLIRKVLAAGTAALALASLSGCALGTRISKPDVSLPTAYEAPQAQTPAGAAALDRWWLLFNDPQLTGLIDQALAASPDAKSAFYRLAEARADRNEAIASILPQGDIKGSASDAYARQKYSNLSPGIPPAFTSFFTAANGSSQSYSANFNVSWELDLYGKDFTAIKTADADLAAARFDYEATRMSLAAQVATSLFQARGLAVQLGDAKENQSLSQRLADIAKRKADAGLITTADAARTESDAESATAQTVGIEAQLKGAQRSLLALIGQGTAPSSTLAIGSHIEAPPPVPAATPGALLARRPDVREAQAKLVSAAGRLRLDKLALFPTFTLQPGLSYSKQVDSIYTITTSTATGGLALTVPILSIPKLLQEVRAQGGRGQQAVAAYEKAVQSAYGDAERGLTTTEADGRRVKLLDSATQRARFAYDAAQKGYDLGLIDLTSVIQAEQTWRATRSNDTSAKTSALVDTVATFKALGGGWDADGNGDKGK